MRSFSAAAAGLVLVHAACSDFERPPPPPPSGAGEKPSGTGGEGFFEGPEPGPPDPDSGDLCGSLVVPLVRERPNLYFIVDASGSMAQRLDPPIEGYSTLFRAAGHAISELLRIVGHRVQFGAAIFPGARITEEEPCPAGREVFATRPGDDSSYALSGKMGPELEALVLTLARFTPRGTTPTAATLRELAPTLRALPGKTYVFLITDGAPNCDPAAECSAETCETNLAGQCSPANLNCCDPDLAGPFANLNCLDVSSTSAALAELHADGIVTYVIGLPGTQAFADVLDQLAVAGGAPRETPPLYYSVERANEIGNALKQIGSAAVISCEIELSEAPPDRNLVNVYLDHTLLPQGEGDGWRWVDETTLEITGDGCDLLKAGDVLQVQVAAGCPTVIR